jgi:hypothetical protein
MEEILHSTDQTEQITACDEQTLQEVHGGGLKDALVMGTGTAVCLTPLGAGAGAMYGDIRDKKNIGKDAGIGAGTAAGAGLVLGGAIGAFRGR